MKLKILMIEDEKLICWSLQKDLGKEGCEVVAAQTAAEGMRFFEENDFDVVLLDIRLPDGDGKDILKIIRQRDPFAAVIVITANDDLRTAIQCMQSGAFTYLHKPFDFDELKVNIEKAAESRKLSRQVANWNSTERKKYDFSSVVSVSSKMKEVMELVKQIISSEATTILLQGESGTGKDLIARTIHYGSSRAEKPFVSLNCAAIPSTLLESELFGHEKGAFTDAKLAKIGLVEEAAGGTLFLDEIGDMARDLQAKLLHLIEQKRFRKLGGVKELEAEIRIIAATNKDLREELKSGKFREDLFYRLNVIPIYIPPLRDRPEDIPELLSYFIGHFNREFKKSISGVHPDTIAILKNYNWPGNIRELRNVIERAMILNQNQIILPQHLPSEIDCSCVLKEVPGFPSSMEPIASKAIPHCLLGRPLDSIEKEVLAMTLEDTKGNQSKAARLLGIGRDALRYKMQKFGLFEIFGKFDSEEPLREKTQSNN